MINFRKAKCRDFFRVLFALLISLSFFLPACSGGGGGGGSDSGGGFKGTDNESKNWVVFDNDGYSGGDVIFGGLKIEGEWQAERTLNVSGGPDSFVSTSNYAVLGIKFDGSYYEYWAEWLFEGGQVVSNAAWTPCGSYGVSQDGFVLTVDNKTYDYQSSHKTDNGKPCLFVIENETGDEYDLCRVSDNE